MASRLSSTGIFLSAETRLVSYRTIRHYLYNKSRYVCLFVCLFVCIYVPYGRPKGWADQDQTWHTHSCPPRECFWQGQCQGHSCMRAGVTELRNTRNAARKRHLAKAAQTTSGGRGKRHLANDYETPSGRRVIAAGSRRRRRRVTRRGAAGAEQRAPKARVELRQEDGSLQLVTQSRINSQKPT